MKKVVTVIGARPQIIKAAAISRAIRESFSDSIKEVIVHTGQHYDENMSAVFMKELNIPAENYNLRSGSGSHARQTAVMMEGIEAVLVKENPNGVIVYGDTNSTLAASIVAAKLFIPVIHVEAGLRSFNKKMPEEINRICCDHVSTFLFAPTKTAMENLQREGFVTDSTAPFTIDNPAVIVSGDVMYDNSLYFAKMAETKSDILNALKLEKGNFILATIHRENNTDNLSNLESLFKAFIELREKYREDIVLPLHPRTRKMIDLLPDAIKSSIRSSGIRITEPASFLDMILLEANCSLVMTDSGGVQKEAYFFNKPCIILRRETEWVELVETGCAVLAETDVDQIVKAYLNFKTGQHQSSPGLFGDGKAAFKICNAIRNNL